MHVGQADVFLRGVVRNEGNVSLTELSKDRLIVVRDGREKRGRRLIAILARNRGVGLSGLKWRAVLPGPRESILQSQADGRRRGDRALLRISGGWCTSRSWRVLRCYHANLSHEKGSQQAPRIDKDATQVHGYRSSASRIHT